MLNQAAVEALYSATYIEDYLDYVENLPDELTRYVTKVRELDQKFNGRKKSIVCKFIVNWFRFLSH